MGLLSSHIELEKRKRDLRWAQKGAKGNGKKRTNADSYNVFELNAKMYPQYKRNMETGMAF